MSDITDLFKDPVEIFQVCPVCEGAEGYTNDEDEWESCDECGGEGGWWALMEKQDE